MNIASVLSTQASSTESASPCHARTATGLCVRRIVKLRVVSPRRVGPLGATAEMIFGGSEQLMKKLITFLSICTTVAILALPVAARNLIARPDNSFQDAACTQEAKDALYASFRAKATTDQAKAYEDAKKYLACPATGEVTEAQQKIIDYLKNFVAKYAEATRKVSYRAMLYNDQK